MTSSTSDEDQRFQLLLSRARANFSFEDAIREWANAVILADEILNDLHASLADHGVTLEQWRMSKEQKRQAISSQKAAEDTATLLTNNASNRVNAAAAVRHKENREMKADVFQWLDSNIKNFKTLDEAATAATKQQPVKFRAARKWVGEWNKLRSASRL